MAVNSIQYETLLSMCSQHTGAVELLKHYRPYLETIPSMRRPQDSIVTLPLPNIRVREAVLLGRQMQLVPSGSVLTLPCEAAFLMCDPEWKVKTGIDIFVFVHRPQEDFSDLLMRWRQTQVLLNQGYEWMLPTRFDHLLSDGSNPKHPLFVVFAQTPERIIKGLQGAALPVVRYPFVADLEVEEAVAEDLGLDQIPGLDDIDTSALENPDSDSI